MTDVAVALRLGWAMAEVRGRNWPYGPRPTATALPRVPGDEVLPLRSQRDGSASRQASAATLVALAADLGIVGVTETDLRAVIPPFTAEGEAALEDDLGRDPGPQWARAAALFREWDAKVQDELTRRSEPLANAYLLGRGLAECYWGLGPTRLWLADGQDTGVSMRFLMGVDRQRELTRMLGRLGPDEVHPLSASAISGSLEAWEAVAADDLWSRHPEHDTLLYEQVRRWYQLLILEQDPTTLVRPGQSLASLRGAFRAVRAFWPQVLLAVLAVALVTAFFPSLDEGHDWVSSLLATSGLGVLVTAGLLARGQSAAQRVVMRMRQDAYTDLVALSVTVVPDHPRGSARRLLENAVRTRRLTPATPPPYTSS